MRLWGRQVNPLTDDLMARWYPIPRGIVDDRLVGCDGELFAPLQIGCPQGLIDLSLDLRVRVIDPVAHRSLAGTEVQVQRIGAIGYKRRILDQNCLRKMLVILLLILG